MNPTNVERSQTYAMAEQSVQINQQSDLKSILKHGLNVTASLTVVGVTAAVAVSTMAAVAISMHQLAMAGANYLKVPSIEVLDVKHEIARPAAIITGFTLALWALGTKITAFSEDKDSKNHANFPPVRILTLIAAMGAAGEAASAALSGIQVAMNTWKGTCQFTAPTLSGGEVIVDFCARDYEISRNSVLAASVLTLTGLGLFVTSQLIDKVKTAYFSTPKAQTEATCRSEGQ